MEKQSFDVLLLDLSLPDSSGLNTLIQVRRKAPALPVVVLTASGSEEIATLALREYGAQDYLAKNEVDYKLLIHSLRYAIERRRAEINAQPQPASLHVLLNTIDEYVCSRPENAPAHGQIRLVRKPFSEGLK